MKNTGVVLLEALVGRHDQIHKPMILRHVRNGRQKPTVTQISLIYVKSILSIADKLWICYDIL